MKWRKIENILAIIFIFYAATISLVYSLAGKLNHDEHQFMASAFMVAQQGLHPYQDFAYFHMPNLVYIYAPFFLTPFPFLLARIFVGICGFAICLLIFLYARSQFSEYDNRIRLIISGCFMLLLLHSPLYQTAVSHVWNHTPSTLFALLAVLLYSRGMHSEKIITILFLTGLCLGMAIGIRASFFPLIFPFLLVIILPSSNRHKTKLLQLIAFGAGGLLANIPAIYFFFTSFQDFWFGNVGYAELNTLYREERSYVKTMTLMGKFKYMYHIFFEKRLELMAVMACIYSLIIFICSRSWTHHRQKLELLLLFMVIPFLLVGALLATPSWYQYYFVLVPFLLLFSVNVLSRSSKQTLSSVAILPVVLFASISLVYGVSKSYNPILRVITKTESIIPIKVNDQSEILRNYVDSKQEKGKVLTLSPIFAVNAKLPIFEEFVTGPFAWRVSHLLSEEVALSRGLPIRSKIKVFVQQNMPSVILTGKEKIRLERPLISAARELGYKKVKTPSKITLWLSPDMNASRAQ